MPIRMTDDEPGGDDDSGSRRSSGGSGRGGGGGGGGSILALLFFFFRYPKLSLVLLLIAGLFYALSDGPSASSGEHVASTGDGLGATLDPKVYDEVLVHEPLAEAGNKGLPERVTLLEFAPPRRSQGQQGSCVGWATSYAARSILLAKQTGADPASVAFSPAYVYNPIGAAGCHGTYLKRALELMKDRGDLPLAEFPYDPKSCEKLPSDDDDARAKAYRIKGFARLSVDSDDYGVNALALKQHLAQGAPVVIGMNVGGTFESPMNGKKVWHPTQADHAREGDWGGHAMAVIGYDDLLEGGAFQIMNSWGDDWGVDGVAWVKYPDFSEFVKEAYGLYPMGDARAKDTAQVIRFGFVETGSLKRIPVKEQGGVTYRTTAPIRKGTRFKVEFSNTKPAYAYIFGQETDGTSYVLFPYTDKHSPYCGTTGTRIFPRKQSLTADDKGTRDSIAVVISPKPLDFRALNARVTATAGATYAEKLTGALGDQLSTKSRIRGRNEAVELTSGGGDGDKVNLVVLEFDKI